MELRSGLRLLREQWTLVLVVTLLATAISGVLTWRETPQYASQVTLFVSAFADPEDPASAYQGSLLSQQKVKSYTQLLRGHQVMAGVVEELGLGASPRELSGKVVATVIPDTTLLTATVTDPSPGEAQRIANAIGEEFVKLVPALESTTNRPPAVRVTVVSPAELPTTPVSPQPVRNLAIAMLLGLLAGFGLAVARRSLDTTIKTSDQLEEITGKPTLGTVAYDPAAENAPLITHDSHSARAEDIRRVRTNLQFVDVDRTHQVVLITSAVQNEGKSFTAANLAIALAQAQKRVILVDGDLRRPAVARYLGLPNGIGLTSVLVGDVRLEEAIQVWGKNVFSVLTSGPIPPNPSELLSSQQMRNLLDELRDSYDAVIIDAPPVLPVADAAATSLACDGVVLVLRHGKTRQEQLRNTLTALRSTEIPILGTVLNLAPPARQPYGYGYDHRNDGQHNAPASTAVPGVMPIASPTVNGNEQPDRRSTASSTT